MPRSRATEAALGAPQCFPAADHMHGTTKLRCHPGRDFATGPQPAIWRWFPQPLLKLGPLLGRQQRARTRVGVPAIAKPRRSGSVVPPGEDAYPSKRIARHGRDLRAGLPTCKEPNDVPMAPRNWIIGATIGPFELRHWQMGCNR